MAGLRERKKERTMHHVQEVALRLFTERGFDAVTVEEVADVAEVSASTIYRYFGTKEGLLLRDEFDDRVQDQFTTLLGQDLDLMAVLRAALVNIDEEHFGTESAMTRRRAQMVFETPALRAAASVRLAEVAQQGAEALAEVRGYTRAEALAITSSLLGCLMAASVAWYEAGGDRTLTDCFDESVAALGGLFT